MLKIKGFASPLDFKKRESLNKEQLISRAGFSLIEFMVVVAIIAIITLIVLINYPDAADQFALERSTHKLAQDIRRAAEMGTSSRELPGEMLPAPSFVGSYGVYFNIAGARLPVAPVAPVVKSDFLERYVKYLDSSNFVFAKCMGFDPDPPPGVCTGGGDDPPPPPPPDPPPSWPNIEKYIIYADLNNDERFTDDSEVLEVIELE
ncbi:MAG: type II secretion system protein, partial [Patescibacteria group bacterium]